MKFNMLAVRVYEHTGSVYSIIQCYERMITESSKIERKIEIMEDYAKVLRRYGKKEKLISLY